MKRMMVGVLALALGLGVVGATDSLPTARAASSDSVAMQLSRMVLSKSTYEAMVKQMMDSMMQAMGQQADAKTQKEMTAVVMEALPYDEMLQFNSKVYGERFKDSELQDIINFYKTPTGAKLVRELPNISGEVGALVGKIIPERLPALMKKHGLMH
ncbi:MAG TPA: DUF2059 domain-containing protein [Polyangiaceae bacterium]|jgi:hypothetical protein